MTTKLPYCLNKSCFYITLIYVNSKESVHSAAFIAHPPFPELESRLLPQHFICTFIELRGVVIKEINPPSYQTETIMYSDLHSITSLSHHSHVTPVAV